MSLRANAPVFIPSAAVGDAGMQVSKGDQLIQQLAAAMRPSLPETEDRVIQKIASSAGDLLIQNLAVAMTSTLPDTLRKLPVAGIFCPYCIGGGACAFHKTAVSQTAKEILPCLDGCMLGSSPRPGCRAHLTASSSADKAIDLNSLDSEEASTDMETLETWYAGSDASDSSVTLQGDAGYSGSSTHPADQPRGSKSHNKIHDPSNEPVSQDYDGAGRANWRIATNPQRMSWAVAR